MWYTWKQAVSDGILAMVVIIILNYANELVFKPYTESYYFETVTKVSDFYENPIFLTFQWETEDELQVGKLIEFGVEISGIPYSNNSESLKSITVSFDENQLNYWRDFSNDPNNRILKSDFIILQRDLNRNVFTSDKIEIRFIVPEDINLEFCDNNIPKCILIDNVIHPAPHDLAVQIETNRVGLGLTLALAAFSCAIVWARLRPKNKIVGN